MKVDLKREERDFDIDIGDIVRFEGVACMIVDLGPESDYYGVLALEGHNAGTIIEEFPSLFDFDKDRRVSEELIKAEEVIITKEN